MNDFAKCPRCRTPLTPEVGGESELRCEACAGVFVPAAEVREELLKDATTPVADVGAGGVPESVAIVCPGCGQPMSQLPLGEMALDRCGSCHGVWLDGGEQLNADGSADVASTLGRYLLYSLSLPERAARSTIGLAAGTAREVAPLLVPQAFQNSKTYEIVVRNSLQFLTEDIGGAASKPGETEAVEGYMARKAVGNFVELAGLTTLHVSPIWILAVASDVAYGTKSYLKELAEELKEQGLIDETSTIHHADDLLESLQQASGRAASLFDTPPLSVEQLRESLEETRAAAATADFANLLPEAELKQYWNEMREIAGRENVSLLGVSGAVTMHGLGKVMTVSRGAIAGVQVAGGLFNRHVIGHYVDSLRTLRRQGFYRTVRDSYAPYVDAVWSNFSVDRETWTAEIVTGRALGKAFRAVKGWFGGQKPGDQPGSAPQ